MLILLVVVNLIFKELDFFVKNRYFFFFDLFFFILLYLEEII